MKRSLAFAVALVITLSGCSGESSPEATPITPTSTSRPSSTPPNSSTSPENEEFPDVGQGTRAAPLDAGTVVQMSSFDVNDEMLSSADITFGEVNWNANDEFATMNYTPKSGNVYVTVSATVHLTGSKDDSAVEPSSTFWLSYVSPDGQSFFGFVNPLEDSLASQPGLYPGASATGTLAFEIPEAATGGLWAVQDMGQSIDPVFVKAE